MSENNSEKIEISRRSFDLEEAKKESPLLFVVEKDNDRNKKLYSELLGVAYTQIRNPDSNLSLLGRS